MAVTFSTSIQLDLLYVRCQDVVEYNDLKDVYALYTRDPSYAPGRPELIDVSEVTNLDLNFDNVRRLVWGLSNEVSRTSTTIRRVVWAPTDAAYPIWRMYQQVANATGDIKVDVFRTERNALDALSLPHRSIKQLFETEHFKECTTA